MTYSYAGCSRLAAALLLAGCTITFVAVGAHDTPTAFVDIRDGTALAAIEEAKALVASMPGLTASLRGDGSDSCSKCTDLATVAFGLLATDPAAAKAVLEGVLCKNTTTAAAEAMGSTSSLCDDIVGEIAKLLSKLAKKALGGGWHLPAILCADILHKCDVPCCEAPDVPEQLHLAFASSADAVGANTTMSVSWATGVATPASVVQWWPAEGGAMRTGFGANSTYRHGGWRGVLHTAAMSDLLPGARYTYRVGASLDGPWSRNNYSFSTLPLNVGTPSRPLRAIQIADMGCGANGSPTIAAISKLVEDGQVDVVLHPGDIGYDDGDEHVWDLYMREIEPFAARVPYMVAPGNHELLWNFSAYKHRFAMPQPQHPGSAAPTAAATRFVDPRDEAAVEAQAMFYELPIGPRISVFMLDSESVIDTAEVTPSQAAWFAAAAKRARSEGRLLLTMTHRPMYCSSGKSNCEDEAGVVRAGIEQTLVDARVALHTTGHLHEYERTLPITAAGTTAQTFASNATYTNVTAPTYIVNGAAGNPGGQNSFKAAEPWSVARSLAVGYSRWTIAVDDATNTASVASAFIGSALGNVVDAFTIQQHL